MRIIRLWTKLAKNLIASYTLYSQRNMNIATKVDFLAKRFQFSRIFTENLMPFIFNCHNFLKV